MVAKRIKWSKGIKLLGAIINIVTQHFSDLQSGGGAEPRGGLLFFCQAQLPYQTCQEVT